MSFCLASCFQASNLSLQAATVTYNSITQFRDPAGPASVPDTSLPNLLQLPTPVYEAQDDGVSLIDQGEAEFRFNFDVDVEPGAVATTVALRQNLTIEFGAPNEPSNFLRTETEGLITYTEIDGVAVDPTDPANQQPFMLDRAFFGSDLPGPGNIDAIVPLDAPATAFEVSLNNMLTAFSVDGIAIINGSDLRFSTITSTPVPEPTALSLLGLASVCTVARRRSRLT